MRRVYLYLLLFLVPTLAIAREPPDARQITDVVKKLSDGDPQVRGTAAAELCQFGPEGKPAVPHLVKMLADSGTYENEFGIGPCNLYDAAFRCLIEIGSESVAGLIAALDDPSAGARHRAAEALGRIGTRAKSALPKLLKLAGDSDYSVRGLVAQSLPKIDPQGNESIRVQLDLLHDKHAWVRELAALSLAVRAEQYQLAVPALLEASEDSEPAVRGRALQALGLLAKSPGTVIPALTGSLRDQGRYTVVFMSPNCISGSERLVRMDAASALGRFAKESRSAGPALVEVLADDAGSIITWQTSEIAMAIGELGEAAIPIIPRLLEISQRQRLEGRDQAAVLDAFPRLGPHAKSAIPALRKLMDKTSDGEVQIAVACALVAIDFNENAGAWKRILAELDQLAADRARNQRWERRDPNRIFQLLASLGPRAAEAVPRLIRLIDTPATEIETMSLEQIVTALGRIGPAAKDAAPAILNRYWSYEDEKCVPALAAIGPDSIPILIQELNQPQGRDEAAASDVEIRVGILNVLGRFGEKGQNALPDLIRLSHDDRRDVRAAAVKALGQIHASPEIVVPELMRRLKDERAAVREQAALSLAAFKSPASPAVEALTTALNDEYIDVRAAAAEALGEIGRPARPAVPALRKALADPSQLVRSAAGCALEKLK